VEFVRQPEVEEVLEDLRRELALLRESIEAGTQTAREFFEERGWEVDRVLAPHIVRSVVKRVLEATGHRVEEMESESLANNGLLYHCGRYSVRILKAQDGDLPAPGPSERRQDFFNQRPSQQRILGWAAASGEEEPRIVHLVVCWDVDHEYELAELYLALPRAGSATKTSVEPEWIVPLDLVGLSGNPAVEGSEPQEEDEDLPIRRKDGREGGAGEVG
jgi:hypothetical protein